MQCLCAERQVFESDTMEQFDKKCQLTLTTEMDDYFGYVGQPSADLTFPGSSE